MTAWLFCKRAGVVKEDGRAATFTARSVVLHCVTKE